MPIHLGEAQKSPLLRDIRTRIYTIIIHDNAWDPLFSAPLTHDTTTIKLSKRIYIRQTHASDENIGKLPPHGIIIPPHPVDHWSESKSWHSLRVRWHHNPIDNFTSCLVIPRIERHPTGTCRDGSGR